MYSKMDLMTTMSIVEARQIEATRNCMRIGEDAERYKESDYWSKLAFAMKIAKSAIEEMVRTNYPGAMRIEEIEAFIGGWVWYANEEENILEPVRIVGVERDFAIIGDRSDLRKKDTVKFQVSEVGNQRLYLYEPETTQNKNAMENALEINQRITSHMNEEKVSNEKRNPFEIAVDSFCSKENMEAIAESMEQLKQGKVVMKSLEELEAMEDE